LDGRSAEGIMPMQSNRGESLASKAKLAATCNGEHEN
jgi:hypothetical protein